MKRLLLIKGLLFFSSLAVLAPAMVLTGCDAPPPSVGDSQEFIYVESNIQTPGGNSIFAFRREADGSLTQVNGSPFASGGTGVQDRSFVFGPYDSDQNIVIDSNRRMLFAVNSGSDTIAVFRINTDGSLSAIPGSPFPSGGTNPVSLGLLGNTLFVVNKNGDFANESALQPNYTAMRIQADGSLVPVPGSTVNVAFGSSPTQAYVVPGRKLLFGADFWGGVLQSFNIDKDGRLHQRTPLALPPDPTIPVLDLYGTPLRLGNFPLGLTTHPEKSLLYVGFVVTNKVGVYSFSNDGDLRLVQTVPNSGLAICWLRTNRSGTRLYTSNNGVVGDPVNDSHSTVSVYDLSDPQKPREIQNVRNAGLGNALQIELSKDERYLYLITQRATGVIPEGQGNALHIYTIQQDGMLSEDHPPVQFDVPMGTQPQGVAVFS